MCVSVKAERGQEPTRGHGRASAAVWRLRGLCPHLLGDAVCAIGIGCKQVGPAGAETLSSDLSESCWAFPRVLSHHIGSLK